MTTLPLILVRPLRPDTCVYTFTNGSQGIQLTSVANLASPLSPASTVSYTYGTDGFTVTVVLNPRLDR